MDERRFDTFTKALGNNASRRRTLHALGVGVVATVLGNAAMGSAEARKKRRRKKKCRGDKKRCGKTCIPKTSCCSSADCGAGGLCTGGVCVTGQGTCPDQYDGCQQGLLLCGTAPGSICSCSGSTSGEIRCGNNGKLGLENGCDTDADCAQQFPDVPGVFCTNGGPYCLYERYCQAPCPD